MTTASAKVIIDAEDLASKKIEEAARNVEKNVKQIKEVGGQAKASTEFIGTLASTLGGSELGSYAGQLAQLTERVSAFSEVSKAGGAGALAFKAGLAGLVGTISFGVGNAIGNAIFQTERWKKELAEATEEAKRLDSELAKTMQRNFATTQEEISLIGDPEKHREATANLLRDIEKQVDDTRKQIEAKQTREESLYEAWMLSPDDRAALVDTSAEESRLAVLRDQRDELQQQLSVRQQMLEQARNEAADEKYLQSLRDELQMLNAIATSKEAVFAIQADRATFDPASEKEANALLRQIDILKEKQDAEAAAEQARQRAADKAVADAERINSLKQTEIDRIRQQFVAITEGAGAARQFALEMKGVDAETAATIASMQAQVSAASEMARVQQELVRLTQGETAARIIALEAQGIERQAAERIARAEELLGQAQDQQSPAQQLTATQGRLLSRGASDQDQSRQIADNTKRSLEQLEKINEREERRLVQQTQNIKLEVVGA